MSDHPHVCKFWGSSEDFGDEEPCMETAICVCKCGARFEHADDFASTGRWEWRLPSLPQSAVSVPVGDLRGDGGRQDEGANVRATTND